jgi:hypothetical protein
MSRAGIVVREQREQRLLAERVGDGPLADPVEQRQRAVVQTRREHVVGDQHCLEQTLELCISAVEVDQGLGEDRVRLLAAEEVELAAEQERDLALLDRVVDQLARFLQMLDCCLTADPHLGRAELDQHVRAVGGVGRLGERATQIRDGTLGGPARARAASGFSKPRHGLRAACRRAAQQLRGDALRLGARGREERRRPLVTQVTLERRERFVDGRPDQRVDERERLPPVSSWHAAQNASSAVGERPSRRNLAVASMLNGAGRITVASGSETIWSSRPGSSPASLGLSPTATERASPSMRGSR